MVATAAPKQSKSNGTKDFEPRTGDLREARVGVYGVLSKLPNPKGYELVFVPSLELLMVQSERRLGRQMSQSERHAVKQRAAVIALPPGMRP